MLDVEACRAVVDVLDVEALADGSPPWLEDLPLAALGAVSILRLTRSDNDGEAFLLVWAVHAPAPEEIPLDELVGSADRAVESFRGWLRVTMDRDPRLRGLVVQATRTLADTSDLHIGTDVDGVRIPPTVSGFRDGAYLLRGFVCQGMLL